MNKAEAKRRAKFAIAILVRSTVDHGWESLARYTDNESDAEVAALEAACREVANDLVVSGKGPNWGDVPPWERRANRQ